MFPVSSDYPVKGLSPVTWTIIGLNALVAVFQLLETPAYSDITMMLFGVTPALVVFDIWPWNPDSFSVLGTLVTYMFVHGSIWHLLGNMLFFHCFSMAVESLMGPWRYALFYMLGGIAAAVVHALGDASSNIPMVGASGAVAAVLAAHTILLPWTQINLPASLIGKQSLPAWGFTAMWVGLQFLIVLDEQSDVAWLAHIGGVAAGLLMAPFFSKPGILVMAPTPGVDAEIKEHGPGYKLGTAASAAVALVALVGISAWVALMPSLATPRTVARAQGAIGHMRLTGVAVPQHQEHGLAIYREGARGDGRVANDLAWILREGRLAPRDEAEAVQWFRRAAEAGVKGGIEQYALALIDGNTVAREPERGIDMLRDLSKQGYNWADVQLGIVFETGRGSTAVDLARALELYKKTCEGITYMWRDERAARDRACYRLALMTFAGRGLPADRAAGEKLLRGSMGSDQPEILNALGLLLATGDPEARDIGREATPEQDMARIYFESAARRGHPDAMYNWARLNEQRPWVIPLTPTEIRSWYERAAAGGSDKAKAILKQQ